MTTYVKRKNKSNFGEKRRPFNAHKSKQLRQQIDDIETNQAARHIFTAQLNDRFLSVTHRVLRSLQTVHVLAQQRAQEMI